VVDPIPWGTVAFLLNYVLILGTALGVVILLLAGLMAIDTLRLALLPAGLYVGIHLTEGETLPLIDNSSRGPQISTRLVHKYRM